MLKILTLSIINLSLAFTLMATPALAAIGSSVGGSDPIHRQNEAFFDAAGIDGEVSIGEIVSGIIKVLLSFLGVIFVVLIIYAGFMWMTSRGNEEAISKAKKIMTAAVIGLAIVLGAYIITYFIIDQILEATKGGTGLD